MPTPHVRPHCAIPLVMSGHQGVEIDYARNAAESGSIAAELDKILERAARDSAPAAPARGARSRRPPTPIMAAITARATATTDRTTSAANPGSRRFRLRRARSSCLSTQPGWGLGPHICARV